MDDDLVQEWDEPPRPRRTLPEGLHPSRIDRVLHDPVRLAMVAALSREECLTFTETKRLLGLTDGNLSVHARRLEDVGYITVVKHARHRATRTEYRLAPAGRRALERYLRALEAFVDAVRQATAPTDTSRPQPLP